MANSADRRLTRRGAANLIQYRPVSWSPHQKISVSGPNFTSELRLARDLLGRPGILRQPQTMLTYYLFHCGQPARVSVEGLSLHTAP